MKGCENVVAVLMGGAVGTAAGGAVGAVATAAFAFIVVGVTGSQSALLFFSFAASSDSHPPKPLAKFVVTFAVG